MLERRPRSRPRSKQQHGRSRGFTLIEVLIGTIILGVGIMSLAMLVPYATENDYRSRVDTTATFVAVRQMEQILAQPISLNLTTFTDGSDDPALNAPVVVNLTDLTLGDAVGTGAPLDANGDIDFTVAPGAVPPGYARIYNVAPSGLPNNIRVNIGRYDVRWNIYQNANGIKTIIVAAQRAPLPNTVGTNFRPANMRAVQMR